MIGNISTGKRENNYGTSKRHKMKKRIDENYELNGEQAAEEPIAGALGKSSVVRLGLRRSGLILRLRRCGAGHRW